MAGLCMTPHRGWCMIPECMTPERDWCVTTGAGTLSLRHRIRGRFLLFHTTNARPIKIIISQSNSDELDFCYPVLGRCTKYEEEIQDSFATIYPYLKFSISFQYNFLCYHKMFNKKNLVCNFVSD
jgi:hypothetical protein